MKKYLIALYFCPALLFAQEPKTTTIVHEKNWTEVLIKAKKEKKMILVYLFSPNVEACNKMQREVLADQKVGQFINERLININVRIDSTGDESPAVSYWRKWYDQERKINKAAGYLDLPGFLFYDAKGNLLYKSVGFKESADLVREFTFAAGPAPKRYGIDLADYQNGKLNFPRIRDLTKISKELYGDDKLTAQLAKVYKEQYMDKLAAKDALTSRNIRFIYVYGGAELLRPTDNYFKAAYESPEKIESALYPGAAAEFVYGVIQGSVVRPILYKNDKPVSDKPDWQSITDLLGQKYPKFNPEQLILTEKVKFYKGIGDWRQYAKYQSDLVEKYPPDNVFWTLNVPAWEVFQTSNDPFVLEQALKWIDLAIKIDSLGVQSFDTKANLLYKLGRKEDAIACEIDAIYLCKKLPGRDKSGMPTFASDYINIIQKMEKNEPTWK